MTEKSSIQSFVRIITYKLPEQRLSSVQDEGTKLSLCGVRLAGLIWINRSKARQPSFYELKIASICYEVTNLFLDFWYCLFQHLDRMKSLLTQETLPSRSDLQHTVNHSYSIASALTSPGLQKSSILLTLQYIRMYLDRIAGA